MSLYWYKAHTAFYHLQSWQAGHNRCFSYRLWLVHLEQNGRGKATGSVLKARQKSSRSEGGCFLLPADEPAASPRQPILQLARWTQGPYPLLQPDKMDRHRDLSGELEHRWPFYLPPRFLLFRVALGKSFFQSKHIGIFLLEQIQGVEQLVLNG